jgi:2-succinyl-5-enolpyruvyl-6-hydroxy-3-cyclohexene-1-carboxylate synthase
MHIYLRHIPHISAILAGNRIRQIVLSPGSRCAPLVLSMVRQPELECYSVVDERSAGFIALGMAIRNRKASVLVCTSGTAGLNYAPAVTEAFYQEVPLIILTADRPAEWIDRWDGQTIRQKGMFGAHVKASFTLPERSDSEESLQMATQNIHEAIRTAHEWPRGPVHINVPIPEPFYPKSADDWEVFAAYKEDQNPPADFYTAKGQVWFEKLKGQDNILVVAGQEPFEARLLHSLNKLSQFPQITLVSDVISNTIQAEGAILSQDIFLSKLTTEDKKALQPQILITIGKSLISKNLKIFLRDYAPVKHLHIGLREHTPDPFGTGPETINISPVAFFEGLTQDILPIHSDYADQWHKWDEIWRNNLEVFDHEIATWSEWKAVYQMFDGIPENSVLHLANSMAVRYGNFFSKKLAGKAIEIEANRGTSGIDGSNGTAVGYSLMDKRIQTLLTGDLAFLYDKNAFWHHYMPANLRVVVINNGGGGIFRLIDGPSGLPELENWFETRHEGTCKPVAEMYQWQYLEAHSLEQLKDALDRLYLPSDKPILLEVFTNPEANKTVFNSFKTYFNNYGV